MAKISRGELLGIYNALDMLGSFQDLSISYHVAKNKRRLKPLVDEYKKEIGLIQDSYAVKHPHGGFVQKKNEQTGMMEIEFGANRKSADDAVEKLNAEEVEFEFHAVKESEHPCIKSIPGNVTEALLETFILD
jgi:hypothetical protein